MKHVRAAKRGRRDTNHENKRRRRRSRRRTETLSLPALNRVQGTFEVIEDKREPLFKMVIESGFAYRYKSVYTLFEPAHKQQWGGSKGERS